MLTYLFYNCRYKDDIPLPISDRYTEQENQGLRITDITLQDSGLYKCVVTITQSGEANVSKGSETVLFILN